MTQIVKMPLRLYARYVKGIKLNERDEKCKEYKSLKSQ